MVHTYGKGNCVGKIVFSAALLSSMLLTGHRDMDHKDMDCCYVVPAHTVNYQISESASLPLSDIGSEIKYMTQTIMDAKPLDKSDPYYSLSTKRQLTVKQLIEHKDDPDALMKLCVAAMKTSNREQGIPEQYAEGYTECGRCAAFAEAMAQYLGNKIPSYSGDAWTIFRRNPGFREYQIYADSIDKWSVDELNNGKGPKIPEYSTDNPELNTGYIAIIPWPGAKQYVYHAGVVILNPVTSQSFFLETRGEIGMNPISGGSVDIDGCMLPIAEVIGR